MIVCCCFFNTISRLNHYEYAFTYVPAITARRMCLPPAGGGGVRPAMARAPPTETGGPPPQGPAMAARPPPSPQGVAMAARPPTQPIAAGRITPQEVFGVLPAARPIAAGRVAPQEVFDALPAARQQAPPPALWRPWTTCKYF